MLPWFGNKASFAMICLAACAASDINGSNPCAEPVFMQAAVDMLPAWAKTMHKRRLHWEAACFAHWRRDFHDIWKANKSPIAREALDRIGQLYDIEREITGKPADVRRALRQEHSKAKLMGEDLELLEAIAWNDDNLTYGTIISVYTGSEEAITALTGDGIDELQDMLKDARRSYTTWSDFLDAFVNDPEIADRFKAQTPR